MSEKSQDRKVEEFQKIPIGISSCLLGQKVRYDGGHKQDKYITETLGSFFDWIPVCPEAELGLGTPRPTIHLQEGEKGQSLLIQEKTGQDLSLAMKEYARKRVQKLQKQVIYGYILKSKSPSCGMERLKVYRGYGIRPLTNGVGHYAQVLKEQWPNLPIEEEGRLCNPVLRENWITRVFAYSGFRTSVHPRPSIGKLMKFHTRWKFSILAHCPTSYRTMGRMLGEAKSSEAKSIALEYESLLMLALQKKATTAKHCNVLEHMLGFFKKTLDNKEKSTLHASVQDYRKGFVPLIVPITLIRHYAELLNVEYLQGQSYLYPHPKELALLSSI